MLGLGVLQVWLLMRPADARGCVLRIGDMQAPGSMLGAMGIERWEKDDVEIRG